MKYPILLAMSLLSLLFGCNSKKTPAKPQEWPRFPETDNPVAQVRPVALDTGFSVKAFYIAPNKQQVYVLAYRRIVSTTMKNGEETRPDLRDGAVFRLYTLDQSGQIKARLDLPSDKTYSAGSFGLLEGQLLLRFADAFLVLDPQKLQVGEKIPVYDDQFFPSKQDVELMTPDEQRDAYQLLFDAVLEQAPKWLHWTPGGEYLVFLPGPAGKRSAWAPMSYADELLAELRGRLDSIVVSQNPNSNIDDQATNFQCADGSAQFKEVEYLDAGTELDYPNYKNRRVLQYEMVVGAKTLHFSTTDKKRRALRLFLSDNLLLTTADGAAWVAYEGVIYRAK